MVEEGLLVGVSGDSICALSHRTSGIECKRHFTLQLQCKKFDWMVFRNLQLTLVSTYHMDIYVILDL